MLRPILFWSTAGGIMMAAGLLPTPSSKRLAELQLAQISLPDISFAELKLPDQAAILSDLGNISVILPEIGQRIENQVARIMPGLAETAPELPVPLQEPAAESAKRLANVVNFDLNEYALDAQAKAKLNDFALWLQANPAVEVGVFGHTDLTGSDDYNDTLGQRRAEQVASFLLDTGIESDRISVVMSYGERLPVVATDDKSRDNRRVLVEPINDDQETGGTNL